MVSQPVINVIIGALLTGTFLIISNLLTNWNNDKREEKQRTWQLEREQQQRSWQEKSDQKKWYREKIYDAYRTSFQVLIKIQQEELDSINKTNDVTKKRTHINNINKLILEFNIEFTMIIANHPDKNSEKFIDKLTTIDNALRAATIDKSLLEEDSSMVRRIMTEIMENDSRIEV
jgi:DNA repair protein RadC